MPGDIDDILKKYFKFDQIFNLLDYGISLERLKEDLLPLCKSTYENNYRFIFLHYDTDYHITNDQPGIILRNLQRILYSLDISNFFCLILTQKDLDQHLEFLRQQETNDECAIAFIKHPLQQSMHYHNIEIEDNCNRIVHKFMCLNRITRFHRTMLYAFLKTQNILDCGAVSYGSRQDK